MVATANLENDHVHILKLCDVMELMTREEKIDPLDMETVVSLIRNFADGLHHRKEEDLLFPKMGEKGFSPDQGPVAVMLHEHVQGRNYVGGIAANLELYKSGDLAAVKIIYMNMSDYVSLLRDHIAKENNILFRMADNALSDEEQQQLLSEFKKAEDNQPAGTTYGEFISQIEQLAKKYNKG
jgi:hemerythrin-like domain-containing protein